MKREEVSYAALVKNEAEFNHLHALGDDLGFESSVNLQYDTRFPLIALTTIANELVISSCQGVKELSKLEETYRPLYKAAGLEFPHVTVVPFVELVTILNEAELI